MGFCINKFYFSKKCLIVKIHGLWVLEVWVHEFWLKPEFDAVSIKFLGKMEILSRIWVNIRHGLCYIVFPIFHVFYLFIVIFFMSSLFAALKFERAIRSSRFVLFGARASRSLLYSSHTFKFISCKLILKLKSIF